MVNNILYNEIFKEATIGRIDCGFIYNVIFQTILPANQYTTHFETHNLQIPTLYISNPQEFEKLLYKYIELAYPFYDKNYFDNEHDYIKAIITFLFVNMTVEDFLSPNDYLQKRIDFFKNNIENNIDETFVLGNSHYIGNIMATINKEKIYEETPFSLNFKTETSSFPSVRFGIHNNTVYIYAIQNTKNSKLDKKTNRILYKINDGFDTTYESFDNIHDYENLTGITNSTIVAATLALSFFSKLGYVNVRMPSFLPVRYNSKEMAREKKILKLKNDMNLDEKNQNMMKINEEIQRNISDKFIRTFRRIAYHFDNINISSYPFDVDSCLHITMNSSIHCNNALLNDLFLCEADTIKKK